MFLFTTGAYADAVSHLEANAEVTKMTVDALGTLNESNFLGWGLSIDFQGKLPVSQRE